MYNDILTISNHQFSTTDQRDIQLITKVKAIKAKEAQIDNLNREIQLLKKKITIRRIINIIL